MSKKSKLLWVGFALGIIGIIATISIAIGTGAIMSREASKTYYFDKPFETLALPEYPGNSPSNVAIMQGDYKVEAYVKAWRPEQIDIDKLLNVEVRDGILYITMNKFPDDFFGMFPQPYELDITVYTPLGDDLKEIWYSK